MNWIFFTLIRRELVKNWIFSSWNILYSSHYFATEKGKKKTFFLLLELRSFSLKSITFFWFNHYFSTKQNLARKAAPIPNCIKKKQKNKKSKPTKPVTWSTRHSLVNSEFSFLPRRGIHHLSLNYNRQI